MWILLLEAGGAVGLLLFIVWWTLGPTQRRERAAADAASRLAAERAADDRAGRTVDARRDPVPPQADPRRDRPDDPR